MRVPSEPSVTVAPITMPFAAVKVRFVPLPNHVRLLATVIVPPVPALSEAPVLIWTLPLASAVCRVATLITLVEVALKSPFEMSEPLSPEITTS